MVALDLISVIIVSWLVAATLDLPAIACYSDTSITTARRGPVAPDALRLAHITTHSHNFAMLMRN